MRFATISRGLYRPDRKAGDLSSYFKSPQWRELVPIINKFTHEGYEYITHNSLEYPELWVVSECRSGALVSSSPENEETRAGAFADPKEVEQQAIINYNRFVHAEGGDFEARIVRAQATVMGRGSIYKKLKKLGLCG